MKRIRILITIGLALAIARAGAMPAPASISPELPFPAPVEPGPGTFLVAKRALDGSYFGQTVVYLIEHDDQGTLGLIVNRSSDIRITEALTDLDEELAAPHRLYLGGPVQPSLIMMLMRRETAERGTAHVAGSVYVSSDRRVLDAELADNKTASELRLYIGYSGWSAGQLDSELERGSWHVIAADADAVFSEQSDFLWQRLIERLEPEGIQVRDWVRPLLPLAVGRYRQDLLQLEAGITVDAAP